MSLIAYFIGVAIMFRLIQVHPAFGIIQREANDGDFVMLILLCLIWPITLFAWGSWAVCGVIWDPDKRKKG